MSNSEHPVSSQETPRHPNGLRVVAIGGGTGLSTLLHGLSATYPAATKVIEKNSGLVNCALSSRSVMMVDPAAACAKS